MNNLLGASMLAAFSGVGIFTFAGLLGINAPVLYESICLVLALPFAVGCLWATLRAFQRFKEARNIRLGISGEQAVAEALGEVSGFRVFHDMPGGNDWNIDHVAVGSRGVFLIETKARRRRGGHKRQQAHEVIYDGKTLQFPFHRETKPIEQAERNAEWLANFLIQKTGERVEVFPIVVFPGWFVSLPEKVNFPVWVMNATYLPGHLRRHSEKIEPAQVRRIISALDDKCRTIEF